MRRGFQGLAMAYGAAVAGLSLMLALIVLVLGDGKPGGQPLVVNVLIVSILGIGGGLSLSLFWAGLQGLRNRASPLLRLPPVGLLLIVFLVLLLIGEMLLSGNGARLLLPPLHVLASLLPPLILIALVVNPLQRAGVGLTRRDMVWQVAHGALVATVLAAILEAASLVSAGIMGLTLAATSLQGQARLQQISDALDMQATPADTQFLMETMQSPSLIVAVGLTLVLLGPATEEITKSLGTWLSGTVRQRLGRAEAFALGAMAGVGFSLVEAVFNGAVLLPEEWAGPVFQRGGTAAIHGLSTALMGLGWHALLTSRSRWRFVLCALAGIGFHGLWNLFAGFSTLSSVEFLPAGLDTDRLAGMLDTLTSGMLLFIFVVAVAILIFLTRRLAGESRRPLAHGAIAGAD